MVLGAQYGPMVPTSLPEAPLCYVGPRDTAPDFWICLSWLLIRVAVEGLDASAYICCIGAHTGYNRPNYN